jgi:Ni,Fe-hydrogenase III small subunit
MMKTLKFLIAPLLVIALTVGSVSAVLAQPGDQGPERRAALLAKVADILGIDQQKLVNAFKQAQQEQRKEALNQRLGDLITAGTLTQQQAEQLKAWLEARPDVPAVGPRQVKKLIEEGKITQTQADALKAWQESKPDIPKIRPSKGEKLVEDGILTQEQADTYKSWSESRPDLPKVGPKNMKKLLEDGMITQEQANQFQSWMKSKPQDASGIRPKIRQLGAEKTRENRDALMTRVASILGIDKQKIVDAVEQAQGEMRGQALDTKLQELIGQGTLTQQQADAYNAWIQSRPNVPKLPMLP